METIRSISPERCMIVDISGRLAPGEAVLELGIALSMDLTSRNGFFVVPAKQYLNPEYYREL